MTEARIQEFVQREINTLTSSPPDEDNRVKLKVEAKAAVETTAPYQGICLVGRKDGVPNPYIKLDER